MLGEEINALIFWEIHHSIIIHNLNKNFHLFSSIGKKITITYRTRACDSYELTQLDTIEKKEILDVHSSAP